LVRKLVLVIALLVAVPVILVGCNKSGPDAFEDTLKGFFSAYNAGNYDKCLTYMPGMKEASEGTRDAMKTALQTSHSRDGDIEVIKIENITVGESTGTADMTCKVQGYTITREVTLDKTGGSWWINWEQLFGPPT
jgi:hypothetical protein